MANLITDLILGSLVIALNPLVIILSDPPGIEQTRPDE